MLFVVALVLLLGHHLLLTTAVTSSDSRINVQSAFESILGITGTTRTVDSDVDDSDDKSSQDQ